MKIIVSRYKEDIEWTKSLSNVVIYNKGEPLNEDNEFMLENVGREGHSIYSYICNNYDQLDEYMAFLQGNPFDHSPNLLSNLKKGSFVFLSENVIHTTIKNESNHWHSTSIYDVFETIFNRKATKEDEPLIFGAGAQFVVSKEMVLKRPKSFYEKIVKLLEYDVNPLKGHPIERLHYKIFH